MLLFALQLCVYVPSMIKNFIYQLKNNFLKKSLPCGGKWIHVYVWLSPFTVHLKLQHFSLAMLMLSCFSRVRLFATLWTVAHQAPLPMGFSRQEYWSGSP